MNKILFSSNSDEYETPQELYDALNAEFHFDLDPCSTDENRKCEHHFTAENNGLSQNWGGVECSVIRHIARSLSGSKKHMMKDAKTTRWLYC